MMKRIMKIVRIAILSVCLTLLLPLGSYAMPEFSPDGKTCLVPGCHREGEVQETIYDVDPAEIAANAPKIAEIEGTAVFSDTKEGMKGGVTVTIAVADGKIVDAVIYGPYETETVGSRAIDEMPAQILEAQNWNVDGVSGATYTSSAIRQAAKVCLIDAGLYEEPAVPEHTPAAGASYYTASGEGFGGAIEVGIGVKDGRIVDVTINGPDETQGIGSNAVEQMPGQILEAQDWNVDGYSGATYSSNAIRAAAKAAMEEAGLLSGSESAPGPETPAVTEGANPAENTAEKPVGTASIIAAIVSAAVLAAIMTSALKKRKHKN